MKNTLSTLALIFFYFISNAQNEVTITIKDTKGKPLTNVEVLAYNETADDMVRGNTNGSGTVVMSLTQTGVYSFSYLDAKNFDTYEVKEGMRGTFRRTVTYDPDHLFDPKEKISRKGISFMELTAAQLRGQEGVAKVNVQIKKRNRTAVPNVEVTLVSVIDKLKFKGKANSSGVAVFYLPLNKSFEVDIEGVESIATVKSPEDPHIEMTEFVCYERANVNEIVKGDTIIQRNVTQETGTTTHLLFTIKVVNMNGVPLENEKVYLQAQGGKRVYQGETNKNGDCKLMVEKSADYIVNLTYEQGLHVVEATKVVGFGREWIRRRYRGTEEIRKLLAAQEAEMKRLEEEEKLLRERRIEAERIAKLKEEEQELARRAFLEEKKKNEKELVNSFYKQRLKPDFEETPIEVTSAPSEYLTSTPTGYKIQFKSSGPIGTPTVIEDKMFIPAGYYSSNFYCLNARTGKFIWGVELGEAGPSPAVYHNGVILINTESCTLYALDASTGKMLWSRWLSEYIYSTPSADGNRVYVVYEYGQNHVLACFGLRTGELLWINRVDSEPIACPVVDGDEVHVTSQSGFYYIFDKESGKPLDVITSIYALSSPTLTHTSIFVTAEIEGKEILVELDRNTHKVKKKYNVELSPFIVDNYRGLDEQMNYNGSHPIVYRNQFVVLFDTEKLRVFDASAEKLLWEKSVSVSSSQVPIVANNMVYVGTSSGELMSFDIETGKSHVIKKQDAEISGQPVANKKLLLLVSSGILTAIRSVNPFEWGQWNKDARHNLNY